MTTPSGERDSGQTGISADIAGSTNGPPPLAVNRERAYCAFCGEEVGDGAPERFAERFCSEAHAEEFVRGVRAARVEAAAAAPAVEAERGEAGQASAAPPSSWKQALKMAACCGAPLLALVVLAGGGGALLGAAGAILPLLLVLACPLGMFFMMRRMGKAQQQERGRQDGERK